jgi:hypothetical protein
MKDLIAILATAALLAGCANAPDPLAQADRGRLVLNEALTIPPNAATARLQYGKVVAFNAVQEHDPFCVFEIDTVAPDPQTVSPASFAIIRVNRSVETFAGLPAFPGFQTLRVGFGDHDGRPSHLYYKTQFRLHDPGQGVRALTCMSNQMAPGIPVMRHLSLAEIRQALGGILSLELPR